MGGHDIRDKIEAPEVSPSNIGKRLAIVFDGNVLSAPVLHTGIDGSAVINGQLTEAEVTHIVNGLNSLPSNSISH